MCSVVVVCCCVACVASVVRVNVAWCVVCVDVCCGMWYCGVLFIVVYCVCWCVCCCFVVLCSVLSMLLCVVLLCIVVVCLFDANCCVCFVLVWFGGVGVVFVVICV